MKITLFNISMLVVFLTFIALAILSLPKFFNSAIFIAEAIALFFLVREFNRKFTA